MLSLQNTRYITMNVDNDYPSALHVQDGVEQPAQVNPYLQYTPVFKPQSYTVEEYVQGITSGDRVFLSKAITLIESNLQKDYQKAQAILEACIARACPSVRIGITGVPGAGKSTFIESFGKYLTSIGRKVAVLAIDPSSERSKGSILGDKTRMETLSTDENAFIRPSPSAGTLGGVARKTAETLVLCEAAGFNTVIIETVGVGQSETAVKDMVDFFLMLMISGAGDELQGIKRGIMEMADAILINKADGDNVKKAELARTQIRNVLNLFPLSDSQWAPEAHAVSSLQHSGMEDVWTMIERYVAFTKANGYFEKNRTLQWQKRFHSFMKESLLDAFYNNHHVKENIALVQPDLLKGKISPYQAGAKVLDNYFNHKEDR